MRCQAGMLARTGANARSATVMCPHTRRPAWAGRQVCGRAHVRGLEWYRGGCWARGGRLVLGAVRGRVLCLETPSVLTVCFLLRFFQESKPKSKSRNQGRPLSSQVDRAIDLQYLRGTQNDGGVGEGCMPAAVVADMAAGTDNPAFAGKAQLSEKNAAGDGSNSRADLLEAAVATIGVNSERQTVEARPPCAAARWCLRQRSGPSWQNCGASSPRLMRRSPPPCARSSLTCPRHHPTGTRPRCCLRHRGTMEAARTWQRASSASFRWQSAC